MYHTLPHNKLSVRLSWHRPRCFALLSPRAVLLLSVQLSAEFFQTAFEPAMVNVFHATDTQMGLLIDLTAILALIPPLLVSFLSRHLKDRALLLIGLLLKLLGMLLYLPLPFSSTTGMRQWQIVVGYLLIIKASIFFTTASMSLFSKTLGPAMSSHSLLGLLAAAQSLGPAVAQLLFASSVIAMFGSPHFAVLALPVVFAVAVIVWPNTWTWLDPDSKRSVLIRQAAVDQQKKESMVMASPV